jgi:hypothetical protein
MTINILTKVRPQRAALIIPPRVNMPTEVRPQRPALTISPTVNMPKGMLRLE